jgi:hypothetical protein
MLLASGLAVALSLGVAARPALAQTGTASQTTQAGEDTLVMKSGQILKGKIISETPERVVFRVSIAGMQTDVPYERSQIEKVLRGAASDTTPAVKPAAPNAPAVPAAPGAVPAAATPAGTSGRFIQGEGTRYYIIELTGEFGSEISQTPISQALKNAKEQKADVIIFMLDAKWEQSKLEPLPDDAANFDEIFRAEDIVPLLVEEVPTTWEKPPRIVFWVKKAMAGASLLPLVSREIYFAPDGKIGGLGNLTFMMEGVGDEVVREKQRSLRMGHAEGWAIRGGYDYRLIQAMARIEYVLSVRYKDGKPELFEGYPKDPGEELLTDSGMGAQADTVEERVNGIGNDVLTLDERNARLLGLSKGTVSNKDELLDALGLSRGAIDVSDRSARIMRDWKGGLERAQTQLRRLLRDFGDVRVEAPGDYDARTKARNQRRRIIRDMRALLRQWGEALTGRWLNQNQIPGDLQLDYIDGGIEIEQKKDRKD